jgi:hypothetical protein
VSALLSPEFASLQLTLVDRFVQLGMGTYGDGLHQLTNLQRRLGLGTPTDPASGPGWIDVLQRVSGPSTHTARVRAIMEACATLPAAVPEHVVNGWPTVGAFSIQVTGTVAQTHFFSFDNDGVSPLHESKRKLRRDELWSALNLARTRHPEIQRVVGGSWLYTMASYASLFPTPHVATAVVRRGRRTFRGMSHWGQFINHRGDVRAGLADEFQQRVRAWKGDDPCLLFPLDTLEVSSPVALFDSPKQC